MLPTPSLTSTPDGMDRSNTAVLSLDFSQPFIPQIQAYIEALGNDARGVTNVALVGQGVAAILVLPALEMLGSLPSIGLIPFGKKEVVDWVAGADFRHNEVRSRRKELSHGETFAGFTVLDGSGRGLTSLQLTELAAQLGVEEIAIRVVNIQAGTRGQVDLTSAESATAGMADLLVQTGLTVEDWTSGRIMFLPGGAGIVGALQALAIHGISEAWPKVIRLNADADKVFRVAEIVDPQALRQWAVGLAARLDAAKPVVALAGEIPQAFREALAALAAEHGVEVRG